MRRIFTLLIVGFLAYASYNNFFGQLPSLQKLEKKYFKKYSSMLKKKFKIVYLGAANNSDVNADCFSLHAMSQSALTENEACDLLLEVVDNFVNFASTDATTSKIKAGAQSLSRDNVYFVLTFWDENMERPSAPYVAEVSYQNKHIDIRYKQESSQALELEKKTISLCDIETKELGIKTSSLETAYR